MVPSLDHVVSERQQHDVPSLKLKLESLAATALDISPRKLRTKINKSWLALGGDSLTAVNFMGYCHEAGIVVDIADILRAESLDDLIDRIEQSQKYKQPASNGIKSSYSPPQGPLLDRLRGVSRGPLDEIQCIGPCSPMQENFIALQSIDPRAYQLKLAVTISSTDPAVVLTTETVRNSWIAVVKRHAALRTEFVESVDRPGKLDQVVWKDIEPQISISPFSEADNKTSFEAYGSKFPHHLILGQAPDNKLSIRLIISHAVVDAVSIESLFRDLFRRLKGTLPADEQMQCGDFLQAQHPDTSHEALSYWAHYIEATEGSFLSSPSSKTSPVGLYTVDQIMPIPLELAQNFSDQSNATLVNACQVAYALVLRCYTGASNVCFSYTASGRQKRIKGLQHAVGNFVNTLPCHVKLGGGITIAEALEITQSDFLDSLPYQGTSLTGNQEMSGPSVRQLSDSLLSFQRGVPETELAEAGFAVDVVSWEAPSDVCDMLD